MFSGSCLTRTCAIVARHADIDFSHFLGHYKSKLGVARETAPFVFTDAQAQVLGGISSPLFKEFKVTWTDYIIKLDVCERRS